jgi:hypothetical protein
MGSLLLLGGNFGNKNMNFFEDIAKKFGLWGELAKQTWKTAEAKATEQKVAAQLAEVQKQEPIKTLTADISPTNFFGDIAKKYGLAIPEPKLPEPKPITPIKITEPVTGIGKPGAGLIGEMFPGIDKIVRAVETKSVEPIKEWARDIGGLFTKPTLILPSYTSEDLKDKFVSAYAETKKVSPENVNVVEFWPEIAAIRPFKPGDITPKMAAEILKVDLKATAEQIKTAFNKALREPKLFEKLKGIAKETGRKELEILQTARDVLLGKIKPPAPVVPKALPEAPKAPEIAPTAPKIAPSPVKPPAISKELEPLVQEAPDLFKAAQEAKAKGLSAEEFVKSRELDIKPNIFETEGVKVLRAKGRGIKTGPNVSMADIGGKTIRDNLSVFNDIPREDYGMLTQMSGARSYKYFELRREFGITHNQALREVLKDKPLDELRANVKSQLIDFYNEATKGIKEVKPEKITAFGPTKKVLPKPAVPPTQQQFVRKLSLEELKPIIPEAVKREIPPTKRPPSLEELGLKEKPPLITRREDVLLRKRIRDEAKGAKIGAIEARRLTREELIAKFKSSQEAIKSIKNDLIKYIDENLPTEAKGRLVKPLTMDNLTRKKAANIFSRVERMKETLTRKELVGEIKKLSIPKGNLAVDYQKQITETITGIDLVKPTETILKKLRGLRDYIQKNGTPLNIQSKYLEKLNRLTKKNVSQLFAAELTELKDTLNQLQKLGKLKQDLKYKYNERERKVALDKLLASTQNIDPKVSGKQTKLDIYKVGTKKVYMDTLHTPRVADMIDGFKGYQGENAKYIKNLGRKETIAKENTRAIVNSALEEIRNLGIEELTEEQQIRMMINIRNREGAFDQVKTLMEKNGLKEIPVLTKQENQVIEILKKYINQYTDDIAAIFEEIENQPFHRLKEYILPIKYEREFNLVPSQTIEQGRYRTTQTFKGFTFERQKGVEKMPRTDILAIFEEAINEQQWYLNMQPELENIKYLIKSEEYLAKGGEMASNWWRNELDIVARRGWSATARSNPVLRQGRINLNQAILGYKVSSILMQPFAIFDAMAYSQSRYGTMATLEILKEFSKAWIIPKYAKQIIAESPALQQRQAGELAIEETLKKVGRVKGLRNTLIRDGMSLVQKADVRTAAGVQQGLENILIKYGIPNAKEEAEFLMNLVSGSNEVVYRPHILASGEGARTWFTFQTFFLNRWGIMIHDLIKSGILKAGGETSWKGLWKRLSALIGLGIFIAGSIAENQARKAIYETTTGKKLPDEPMAKTAMMFIPEQIPYFGNIIESADRGGDANPPVIRTVENVFSGGASLIKGVKPETKIKGALRMTEAGITLGAGIPGTTQFFDLLGRIFLESKKKGGIGTGMPSLKMPSLKMPSLKMPSIKI